MASATSAMCAASPRPVTASITPSTAGPPPSTAPAVPSTRAISVRSAVPERGQRLLGGLVTTRRRAPLPHLSVAAQRAQPGVPGRVHGVQHGVDQQTLRRCGGRRDRLPGRCSDPDRHGGVLRRRAQPQRVCARRGLAVHRRYARAAHRRSARSGPGGAARCDHRVRSCAAAPAPPAARSSTIRGAVRIVRRLRDDQPAPLVRLAGPPRVTAHSSAVARSRERRSSPRSRSARAPPQRDRQRPVRPGPPARRAHRGSPAAALDDARRRRGRFRLSSVKVSCTRRSKSTCSYVVGDDQPVHGLGHLDEPHLWAQRHQRQIELGGDGPHARVQIGVGRSRPPPEHPGLGHPARYLRVVNHAAPHRLSAPAHRPWTSVDRSGISLTTAPRMGTARSRRPLSTSRSPTWTHPAARSPRPPSAAYTV